VTKVSQFDFAFFVLSPDDIRWMRNNKDQVRGPCGQVPDGRDPCRIVARVASGLPEASAPDGRGGERPPGQSHGPILARRQIIKKPLA
jgi:hypothetical protein